MASEPRQDISGTTKQSNPFAVRMGLRFRSRRIGGFCVRAWIRFWMLFVGTGPSGRIAAWLVTWFAPPHYDRLELRFLNPKGFIAPSAILHGKDIRVGPSIYVDDRTLIFQKADGGPIEIGKEVTIFRDTVVETINHGRITLGEKTRLQAHCFLSADQGSILIGADVGIAPYCAFYPHDHGTQHGQKISAQPVVVKGDIVVEDGAWLGHGVTVLSGVRIGKGAVIGAGSVVTHDVPENAIACGVPAKVLMKRKNPSEVPTLNQTSTVSREENGRDPGS